MNSRRHLLHFAVLVVGLFIIFIAFSLLRYNQTYQFYAAVAGVLYYLLWGIIHHYLEGRLDIFIIGEYLLIGGFVTFLFAILLLAL